VIVEVALSQSTQSVVDAGLRYLTCPNSEYVLSIDILVAHQHAALQTCPLVAYLFTRRENENKAPIAIVSFGNAIPPAGSVHKFSRAAHLPPYAINYRGYWFGDDPCTEEEQDPHRLFLALERLFSLDNNIFPAIDELSTS
jgi:hypothetical protein